MTPDQQRIAELESEVRTWEKIAELRKQMDADAAALAAMDAPPPSEPEPEPEPTEEELQTLELRRSVDPGMFGDLVAMDEHLQRRLNLQDTKPPARPRFDGPTADFDKHLWRKTFGDPPPSAA